MERLYAPWRAKYTSTVSGVAQEKTCVFCEQFDQTDDATFFILKRIDGAVVLLNRYPYNSGHLLIMPAQHVANMEDLSKNMRANLIELANSSIKILKDVLKAQGINLGVNLGTFSGASSPDHLHIHVLPRWRGDTNFLPLLADTKTISIDLVETYKTLVPHFQKLVL